MGIRVFRAKMKSGVRWGCERGGKLHWFRKNPETLREFLESDIVHSDAYALESGEEFSFLSPVTNPCQIVCQGKNYLEHLLETGVKPKDKDFNILFTKADSSLAPPIGSLEIPKGVRLLDYEIELGLVLGKEIGPNTRINRENFAEYVAGIVIANDFSARDIQVPQRQWFKGKSFRGFCPVGPFLYVLDKGEQEILDDLELELKVNGEIRQKANTRQLMFKPLETLQEIQTIFDLRTGDLLLTGTPGGVAMKVKPKTWFEEVMNSSQGDKERFQRFVEDQAASGRFLKAGDVVESRIHSDSQKLDLGTQKIEII